MTMKAVRLHGVGDLRVEQIDTPTTLPDGAVLLRVLAAGICGSDLHNYHTGAWISGLPVTPGHEFCAEVVAVGAGVTGFANGDRVVADSRATCGECERCLSGAANLCPQLGFVGEVCDGGFAEWTVQPAERLIRVDADVPPAIAALSEPLAVALHVVTRLEPRAGEPIVVAGGGTIGGLVTLLLNDMEYGPVFLAENRPARRDLLRRICNVSPVELTPEAIVQAVGSTPRLAVDATGSHAAMERLIASVGSGSRIALVGLFDGAGAVDLNTLVEREIDLLGCSVFRDEQQPAAHMLPRLTAKLEQLVEDPVGLDEVPARYMQLSNDGRDRLKSIIVPTANGFVPRGFSGASAGVS